MVDSLLLSTCLRLIVVYQYCGCHLLHEFVSAICYADKRSLIEISCNACNSLRRKEILWFIVLVFILTSNYIFNKILDFQCNISNPDMFVSAVFSAVSGVELSMSKEQHKCKADTMFYILLVHYNSYSSTNTIVEMQMWSFQLHA